MAEFNEKEFIVTNIVNGIKKGTFAKEYGNIMAVKFVAKGFITFEEVAIIDAEITAWEEAQKIPTYVEPPVEEPIEDGTTDETEIEDEPILDGEGTEEPTEIIEDSTNDEELPEAEPTEATE